MWRKNALFISHASSAFVQTRISELCNRTNVINDLDKRLQFNFIRQLYLQFHFNCKLFAIHPRCNCNYLLSINFMFQRADNCKANYPISFSLTQWQGMAVNKWGSGWRFEGWKDEKTLWSEVLVTIFEGWRVAWDFRRKQLEISWRKIAENVFEDFFKLSLL